MRMTGVYAILNTGKKLSPETKARMSASRMGRKGNLTHKGVPWTAETRAKHEIARMARPTLKPGEAKDTYVRVRVTKAERAKIKRRWKASDSNEKTEAAWMRKQLLGED